MSQKKTARAQMRNQLKSFFAFSPDIQDESDKAASFFLRSDLYTDASLVLVFVSTKLEIDTSLILHTALKDKKKVAVPRILSDTQMDFFYLQNDFPLEKQLISGAFGILEPADFLIPLVPEKCDSGNSVMIVPGLAFTADGFRLGKGKGFYDRYLERFEPAVLCGLCFDFQIVQSVPHTCLDKKVQYLASNAGLAVCG